MILELSDGTTTCDLIWHSRDNRKYMLARDGWAPKITRLRQSTLGGFGSYTDEIEEIELHILGENDAEVLENLANLVKLLDQAERFWRLGQNVSPVLINYAPNGSDHVLSALVLGRAAGDETGSINLPITTNRGLNMRMIEGVRVRILRRGLWLDQTREDGTQATGGNNPTVQTSTLATNIADSSPTVLQFGWSDTFWPTATFAPVILWATEADKLVIFEAESGTLETGTASQADAANDARGGNVARYTPPDTNLNIVTQLSMSGVMDSNVRRIGVWAAVRNNSGSTTWLLQARLRLGVSVLTFVSPAPLVPIDTSTTNPRIVFLGVLSSPSSGPQIEIAAQASAASGTLDIDYVAAVALDDERSGALVVNGALGQGSALIVNPQALTAPEPSVVTNSTRRGGYAGDAAVHTNGTTVVRVFLQTTNNHWVMCTSAGAVIQTSFLARRNNAYVVPR